MQKTENLLNEYKSRKQEIRNRLDEFYKKNSAKKEELFVELCYCICTPLSKAEKVYQVVTVENKDVLLEQNKNNLAKFVKGICRFHNNKADYIIKARNFMDYIKKLPKDGIEARDFIVQNVKGVKYKEASHFLRNIGYKNLAIIDSHILNSLKEFGVIKSNERPKNRKEYFDLENKIKSFSKDIKIPMDELDLLLWSMKTGKVLK